MLLLRAASPLLVAVENGPATATSVGATNLPEQHTQAVTIPCMPTM